LASQSSPGASFSSFSGYFGVCDNVSSIYLYGNLVQHQRTKHTEMDIHFVQKKVARNQTQVLHVPSRH